MRRDARRIVVGIVAGIAAAAGLARADVTGSYDGSVAVKKPASTVATSAVFSTAGKLVNGTIALPADLPTYGGTAYIVTGKGSAKKINVHGPGAVGVNLKFTGKIVGDTVKGPLIVKTHGQKPFRGTATLTKNVSTADGSSCDGVYNANQSFFDTQVLGVALVACKSCHEAGLQAGATRFRVDPTSGLATARSMALRIDSTNPTASRILQKPLNTLPHGGNVQITAGGTEDQILQQWVGFVAAAHCN